MTSIWTRRLVAALTFCLPACSGLTDVELKPGGDPTASAGRALTLQVRPMSVARYQHAVVPLADGAVMAIGGWSLQDSPELASTEIYDPATDTWSAGPSLLAARRGHRAVTLDDGRVLVIGGVNAGGVLDSSELYDPATGSWSATGAMAIARSSHTALKLSDGRVLVVGAPAAPALTEIYDPATGVWSSAGSTQLGRMNAGLVELSDGRVLLVGGSDPVNGAPQTSCELWDPATASWAATASTQVGRNTNDLALARLHDGRVLAAGNSLGSLVAELYDPGTSQWVVTGSLNDEHVGATSVVLDDGTVVFGGGRYFSVQAASSSLERYDEAGGTWSAPDALTTDRAEAVGVPLTGGSALIVGGYFLWSDPLVGLGDVDRVQSAECVPTFSPTSATFPGTGGAGSIAVTVPAGCLWMVQNAPGWVSIDGSAEGVGAGTLTYTVNANTGVARSGNIVINGASFSISQDAVPCGPATVSPGTASFGAAGGSGAVLVTIGNGCPWTVSNVPAWITITSGQSGTGTALVHYTVALNSAGARSATLTVAGQPVTISQAAGAVLAAYSATWHAPACTSVAVSCDTGTGVSGRASLGPELNAPNTLQGTCVDGTAGTYHSDESLDRIKISSADGTPFAPGKVVNVDVTVWAWSGYSSDKLDVFTSPSAASPTWTWRATLSPTHSGAQTLRYSFTLGSGSNQVVRAQFRYLGSAALCMGGGFNDRDDLVFAVGP